MKCSSCVTEKTVATKTGRERLPKGWHRRADDLVCGVCWSKQYCLRAVSVPLAEITGQDGKATPEECKTFWTAVNAAWSLSTQASNWFMTEFYARDVRRNGQEKLPPMPKLYLYPEARLRFPELPSQTMASMENGLKAVYRRKRLHILWTGRASLPSFRYPSPFIVPAQGYTLWFEGRQTSPSSGINPRPFVAFRLGDARWTVRLKGGHEYRRQTATLKAMAEQPELGGELALLKHGNRLMVKIAAWIPRQTREADGLLKVRTLPGSLLEAVNVKNERIWTYNADHVRRWAGETRPRRVQRLAEDAKLEQRNRPMLGLQPAPDYTSRRIDENERFNRRMDSATHQIAASVVKYAVRNKFATLEYDDKERGWCPTFRWHDLALKIKQKCQQYGLGFIHASGEVAEETAGPLAEEQTDAN